MLQFERKYWNDGICRIAGVDEAGRGPLAGPVVAAAVILDRQFAEAEEKGLLSKVRDSKKVTALQREKIYDFFLESSFIGIGVGFASVDEIDSVNILNATHMAMARAVAELDPSPEHVLVDGLSVKGLPCSSTPIIKGDSLCLSVAAASIVAKVVRDEFMLGLDAKYPEYGFAKHKGYGTSMHMQALFEYGPSPVHRASFRPVRDAGNLRKRR